jgi:glutamyl-tRNA reductase
MSDSHPHVFMLGTSHHTAPLAVREKLALDEARLGKFAERFRAAPALREFTVINTCNRVEIYAVASGPGALEHAQAALCDATGCTPVELAAISHSRLNAEAVAHLFEVAAGLDSQIVGETEILGQVKDAYEAALARKWTGPVLNRVFQKTFQAAKVVRSDTGIGAGQVSVASVAVDLAEKIHGDLARTKVLVVGAGDIGLKTAQAFQSRGVRDITVASRTLARAEETAAAAGGWATTLDHLDVALTAADIVACSTSAPGVVVTKAMVEVAMPTRRARPIFLIDLALPRDVDPAAADIDNVYLYNLDDLADIAEQNLAQRQAEAAKGRAILAARTAALWPQVAQSLAGRNGAAPPASG